ncbi:DUF6042 family protein [Streptomyces sp. b84]|uniref:DUF6042 family protein n=1 Tax=Streptomyces sp. b84 TaxID=1827631 RepID=UPI000BEF71F4|nr:DUF6042 family protein [Streptomyces sp. b84]
MMENTAVPGQRRDMALHNDWFVSGWEHVLPRQALALTMLMGTASQPGFAGSLDDLLQELCDGHWDMIGGDLDGALTFTWHGEEWDYEEAPEGREACEAARWEKFGAMLTAAGFPVPTTVRDLAELYLTWGLARRHETPRGTRWSMPTVLPLPGDLLLLDTELTRRLDKIRWIMRTGPLVDVVVNHLIDELGEPQEIFTSLDRLAGATGQDVNDLRLAVTELVQCDDAKVLRGQDPADPERLEPHHRFRLIMDWVHFHDTRVELSLAHDDA